MRRGALRKKEQVACSKIGESVKDRWFSRVIASGTEDVKDTRPEKRVVNRMRRGGHCDEMFKVKGTNNMRLSLTLERSPARRSIWDYSWPCIHHNCVATGLERLAMSVIIELTLVAKE